MASRNVQSYIKAVKHANKLRAKYQAKYLADVTKLEALRHRMENADNIVLLKYAKLRGVQITEANRFLDSQKQVHP